METLLEVHDQALHRLVPESRTLDRVASGFAFTEGPIWVGDSLLFSDLPNNRIVRYRPLPEGPEITTFRCPSGFPLGRPTRVEQPGSNGLTLDRQRRLIACEHGNRRVSRTEPDGSIVALADRWQGKRLNSPNDVVVRSDGTVFFTDPPYGLVDKTVGKELPFQGVYRVDPSGALDLLADDFDRPNGLAFSPDEQTLYVDDTARRHIRAFDVADDGRLSKGRLWASLEHPDEGGPDGMKVDTEGNVYCTAAGGIWVFDPSATLLGRILAPDRPANCAWGDADCGTLYITARANLYRLRTAVIGVPAG